MTERQSGLRFDIYERIHLADDTVGVKQLEEVELVPHIQVYTEGEQALLKGHLYLTGAYEGETGPDKRTLEHLIPVEITLPLNRIHDVNQVSVDIDNFDVDLLSARSLNVTGILTLHGIEMLSVPEEEWREEEETVFIHEAVAYGDISRGQQRPELQQENLIPRPIPEPQLQESQGFSDWRFAEAVNEASGQYEQAVETMSEVYVEPEQVNEYDEWLEPVNQEEEPAGNNQPNPVLSPAQEAPAPVQEEKKELKIAFGSKQPAGDSSAHLKSLINTNEYRYQGSVETVAEETPTPRTDALEWKRLFGQVSGDERRFAKVRVCIVQKDETLDSIAQRYNLNAREIILYNQLADPSISEGKVLFIPK